MQSDVPYELGDKIFIRGRSNSWELQTKADVELANHAYAEGRKSVQIKTPCPSCGFTTLCVDDSGNLVCSFLECKNPTEIANKEGQKAAEKDFKELLELANEAGYFNQDIMVWRMKYADWKKARGIE